MPSIEALTDEIMEGFTDALAPEWAGEAEVCWAASQTAADEAGVDPESVFRDEYGERFYPRDEQQMEWVLRKRAIPLRRAESLKAQRDHEVMLLTDAFNRQIRREETEAAFFTEMVERGIKSMEPDAKGKRTMRTVVGTAYAVHRESIIWPDDDALIEIGRSLGVEPRVKESPDKTAIKAALEIAPCDGELVVISKATGEPIDALSAETVESVVIK